MSRFSGTKAVFSPAHAIFTLLTPMRSGVLPTNPKQKTGHPRTARSYCRLIGFDALRRPLPPPAHHDTDDTEDRPDDERGWLGDSGTVLNALKPGC